MFHSLMFGSFVPIARPLPVGTIPAFATIVTDPVAKLYLLPVTIAVAFALATASPIDKLTLLPVTEKFASAAIVTEPVPIFN